MDEPWVIASLTLLVFLAVHVLARLALWVYELRGGWKLVSAWNYDASHTGVSAVRLRLPAPGYQVVQRGKRFRGQRVGRGGEVVATFKARRHMGDALRDCWADFEAIRAEAATGSNGAGAGRSGSALPGGAGTLHTA